VEYWRKALTAARVKRRRKYIAIVASSVSIAFIFPVFLVLWSHSHRAPQPQLPLTSQPQPCVAKTLKLIPGSPVVDTNKVVEVRNAKLVVDSVCNKTISYQSHSISPRVYFPTTDYAPWVSVALTDGQGNEITEYKQTTALAKVSNCSIEYEDYAATFVPDRFFLSDELNHAHGIKIKLGGAVGKKCDETNNP
jgi:hypothetical protein